MNPTPLDLLSFATFREQLNSRFRVEVSPTRTIELELIEAEFIGKTENGDSMRPKYENFSLIFRGTAEQRLAQATYRFTHPKIGGFDLFIVPIAAEGGTIRYQAVFNRLLTPG